MDTNEQRRHSSSFGAAATAYAEHRPDYAQAAVQWALDPAPGQRVLDLGAGTGKLTGTLVALGADVTAVEPDPDMLAELRRTLPNVAALPGSAEAIPLPDASVDAVVAGNAMHWFDMAVAGPEIARVLAPGGFLAGLWNVMDDEIAWIPDLERVSGSAAIGPRDTVSKWRTATANMHLRTAAPPDSARRSRPSSGTVSDEPRIHSSRPSRRARECWSCPSRSERRRSAEFALSSRAGRRPLRVISFCPCSPACCAFIVCEAAGSAFARPANRRKARRRAHQRGRSSQPGRWTSSLCTTI